MFLTQNRGMAGLPALLLAPCLLAGCAAPGTPRAPSLHLPEIPGNLQAQRLGDQVVLTFTTPTASTDGGPISLPMTGQICRQQSPQSACLPLQRQPVVAGPTRLVDTLPPSLLTGPPVLLSYRVELANRANRSAGASAPAFTASGPAPAPVGALLATSQPGGVQLTWQPAAGVGNMTVRRTQPGPKAVEALLRAPSTLSADPGGLVDPVPRNPKLDGVPFVYVAQRTFTFNLAGQSITLLGLPSAPVTLTYQDTFPPPAPTGLLSIPSVTPPAIDLSWEPASAAGLLGYNVYRRDAAGAFARLNFQPVAAPAFRDTTARPNHPYTYRVTALSQHQIESQPSAEVVETIKP